ncbi:MAG: hypothetical protein ACK5XN_06425 [Bacteroidota bacterium]
MEQYIVNLALEPKQIKQMAKGRPTQVKKDQLDGKIKVVLDKANFRRYKKAKKAGTGFRVVMNAHMIEGSGFADILKGLKEGAKKVAVAAAPAVGYVKDKLKSLLPSVRNDVNAFVNSGTDAVASKIKSGLSPILGDNLANELVDMGSTSVKDFAQSTLNQAEGYLRGLGLKKRTHFSVRGGKFSLNFGKVKEFLKPLVRPVAELAAPALAASVGGPAAGVAASLATDALLSSQGMGVPPRLYLRRPGALPHEKEQLKGKGMSSKIIAVPKKAARGRKRKINGAALLPMGSKGGALFPM